MVTKPIPTKGTRLLRTTGAVKAGKVRLRPRVAVPINENGDPEAAVMTAKETVTSLSCVWIFQPVLEYPFIIRFKENYQCNGKDC